VHGPRHPDERRSDDRAAYAGRAARGAGEVDLARRYAPIRDYAVIGDGRTAALVARDGAIDWLCLPNLDSPSLFAALLDADRGGRFELCPDVPFEVQRRYVPGTNVLETTFVTAGGTVRVTDAMTLPEAGLAPIRELARRIEGLAGRVPMRWRVEPRFGYGLAATRFASRGPIAVALSGGDAVAVCAWDAGRPSIDEGAVAGRFEIADGGRAMLALISAHGEPLVFPPPRDVEARLDATTEFWRNWSAQLRYAGPWRTAVVRSTLALKLLVFAPSGAIAAAATTSLPEGIGGERNWDYRYCWIRDSSFALEALLQLGCHAEATSFFWWFMHATQLTRPRLQVFYRLDGGTYAPELALPLAGYRGSRPVRIGNGAAGQLQLDTYGELLDTAFVYTGKGYSLDAGTGRGLARVADFVCEHWREPDAGIWEVRAGPRHHTQSKAMCWVALDRAARLADAGHLPSARAQHWRDEAAAIRHFIETKCWSTAKDSYVGFAGGEDLDASLLLMAIMRYDEPDSPRLRGTVTAIQRELSHGPFLYRYSGDDGLAGGEGAFLCCSFWLVEALAIAGRREEATRLMNELVAMANDVGLYAEEIEPASGEFLGNFPQGLVHLALVSAAACMAPTSS
jgi:GH15 family glucan-1,4-alpha-glucosidase